jgi:hypothetical protein
LQERVAILEGLHRKSLRRQTAFEYFPRVLIVINNVNFADDLDVLMTFAPGDQILPPWSHLLLPFVLQACNRNFNSIGQ